MARRMRSDFRKLKVSEPTISIADFYPLRMTVDHRTEMYVKFAKVMIIFQGPVTDKRRAAVTELASKFKYAGRLVSDETYTKETGRSFSHENIENFYRYFKDRVKKSCEEGYNLIIIDQSMTNSIQMKYFFHLAQMMQYLILPYPPLVDHDAKNCSSSKMTQASNFSKSTGQFVAQPNLFNHLFCGWFLHDVDSVELREEINLYVQDCFDNIPDFRDFFSRNCKMGEFRSHYNMVDKRQDLAFCTVKILQNLLDIRGYMSSESFMKFYGSMSKLYIVGFIISPHIIAARVRLTHDQRKLWELPDDLDEGYKPTVFPSELLKGTKVNLPTEEVTLIASKSNRTIIAGETIHEPTEAIHPRSRGRSCHILLGKVQNASPQNVDYDVPFAVCRERNVVQKHPDEVRPYDLDRCLVRRIGKYWFVYLKETLIVNGLFATSCSIANSM